MREWQESTVVNVKKHPSISKSQDVPEPETSKPRIREPVTSVEKSIYKKLEQERVAWDYYGPAWMRILNQIGKEKGQRRHELFLIDCRKRKLEEWRKRLEQVQYDLTAREGRILESQPYLSLAKKLQEMKLTLEDALPWIETINEVAQIQNTDINHAAIFVAQELRLNRQLGGIQRQIEKANQELALINMTTIQKQEALTILMHLMNRGVTESQIIQLINFASEWNKYWKSSTNDNLQQPVATNGSGNLQQPNNGSNNPTDIPPPLVNGNGNNGYGGNFSINDLIKLNLLKSTTTNMLNKMGTTH